MRFAQTAVLALMVWALNAEEPKPVSPFAPNVQAPPRTDARPGVATMSDGKIAKGLVMFTRGRKLEVFEETKQKWHAFDLADISRLDNEVVKEEKEREWRFKEGGNDEKVFTGRVFIDHKYRLMVTLADGKTKVSGRVRGTVFYVQATGEEPQRYFLHSDFRGAFGGDVKDLVYFKSLVLDAPLPEKFGEKPVEKATEKPPEKKEEPAPPAQP
jgi:hypothetical protein